MHSDVIATEHAARLAAVDSLLPGSTPFEATENAVVLEVATGDSAASALASRVQVDRDAPNAPWRALTEHRLDLQLAGPQPAAALDALLTRWDEHLRAVAEPGDTETAAIVPRASRDAAGAREMLHHGFAPLRVVAVRPAQRLVPATPLATPGVKIRRAEPGDLETAVELGMELHSYDAQYGTVNWRTGVEEILAKDLAEQLKRPEPPLWIAELYGRPLGMVSVQHPGDTGWISGRVAASRVGYLSSLAVAEAARSSGVGTALATHAHHVLDEEGADVVLLHHAAANPLSTPFWYAQGYRPLWTYWQRRPAVR
ncbi:GNAT family N-acetyltransferase [Amycolatopsis sp. NPDC024027]|uniref:GNAT family N-acetyltransferase n=1 Tax=Amycolatopsis sp. NPDC024027 TaxID=3154327 RepID=UPI0033C7EB5D